MQLSINLARSEGSNRRGRGGFGDRGGKGGQPSKPADSENRGPNQTKRQK
jgi:hypothetical protein